MQFPHCGMNKGFCYLISFLWLYAEHSQLNVIDLYLSKKDDKGLTKCQPIYLIFVCILSSFYVAVSGPTTHKTCHVQIYIPVVLLVKAQEWRAGMNID